MKLSGSLFAKKIGGAGGLKGGEGGGGVGGA